MRHRTEAGVRRSPRRSVRQCTDALAPPGIEGDSPLGDVAMNTSFEPACPAPRQLTLDTDAMDAARLGNTPDTGGDAWCRELLVLLNGALATELVCVLRYKRHHFTAHGLASPHIAAEFAVHAAEAMAHADQIG